MCGHFLQLPLGFFRSKVNRRAHAHRAHVERLANARKPDLIEAVRVREEFVVVELQEKRNLVRVLPGRRTEHAKRGRDTVAAAFDSQLHDVRRIEVRRILGERRAS